LKGRAQLGAAEIRSIPHFDHRFPNQPLVELRTWPHVKRRLSLTRAAILLRLMREFEVHREAKSLDDLIQPV